MGKCITIFCFIGILNFPLLAQQRANSGGILFWVGFTSPLSPEDFKVYWKPGLNLGGGLAFKLTRPVSLVFDADYHQMLFDEEALKNQRGSGGSETIEYEPSTAFSVSANLKVTAINSPSGAYPYFIAGIGYMRFKSYETFFSESTNFGDAQILKREGFMAAIGIGVDPPTGKRINLTLEVKLCLGFLDEDKVVLAPLRIGIKLK